MKLIALLAATALATVTPALPAVGFAALAAPVKGIKKICPDGTRVPLRKECPPTVPDPDPEPEPEPDPDIGTISVADVSVNEGAGTATVTITKTGTIVGNWDFHYTTSGNTAVSGTDFTAASGDKSIAAATPSTTFTIPINDDAFDDDNETLNVTLSAPSANITIFDGTGVVTIIDNDDPPVEPPPLPTTMTCPDGSVVPVTQPCPVPIFYVQDRTIDEAEGTINVNILKVGSNLADSVLSCSTSNGTATGGSDYTVKTGSVSVPKLTMQGVFSVVITNDVSVESSETLNVTCSVTSNGSMGDAVGVVTIQDNDTAPPVDPPPPSGTPGGDDEPAESLEGYTWRTVTDFTYTDALQTTTNNHVVGESAPDTVGAFRMTCGANQLLYDDYILYFGEAGKSHLHDYNGAKTANASSTFATLLASGGSACNWQLGANAGKAVQRSAYWIPALLTGTGHVIRPDFITLYYKRWPKTNPNCGMPTGVGSGPGGICIEIPNGLKSITGKNPSNGTSGPTNIVFDKVTFKCQSGGSGTYANLETFAAGAASCSKMTIDVKFPTCWDGKYLWKNNRDHLRYPKNHNTDGKFRCETTHPYRITEVSLIYTFNITGINKGTMKLSSDYMDPTKPRGWSLHSDMHIVWDARVKRMMHDFCIEKQFNCSAGDLGNGQQVRGASVPEYGWTNPNRLTVEPPMPPNMVMP